MKSESFIYIIANKNNTVLYTGVTSNLISRIYQHKEGLCKGFSKKYNLNKLVYYELYNDINLAIEREKQIKAGSRSKKEKLINKINHEWKDLYIEL